MRFIYMHFSIAFFIGALTIQYTQKYCRSTFKKIFSTQHNDNISMFIPQIVTTLSTQQIETVNTYIISNNGKSE